MKRFCSGGEKTRVPPAEQPLRIASEPPLPLRPSPPPPPPEARITFGRNPRAPVADPHVAHLWNPARRRVSRSRRISRPPITSAAVPAAAAASSRPLLCRRRPISFAFLQGAPRRPSRDSSRPRRLLAALCPANSPASCLPAASPQAGSKAVAPVARGAFASPLPPQVTLACLPAHPPSAAASVLPQPRRLPRSSPGPSLALLGSPSFPGAPAASSVRLPRSGTLGLRTCLLSDFAQRSPISSRASLKPSFVRSSCSPSSGLASLDRGLR